MSRRTRVRGYLVVCVPVAIAFIIAFTSWSAEAQHVAKEVRPAVPGTAPTRLAPKSGQSIGRMPRIPGTKRVVQDFEQKVEADGSIVGTPVELEMGVQETVAEIMERQDARTKAGIIEEHEAEDRPMIDPHRQFIHNGPESPQVPQWPIPDPAEILTKTESTLNPQTIGTTFTGPTIADSGFIPPDSMGAVGPTQFISIINGRLRSFTKAGVADSVLNVTTDTFFNTVRNASGTSDPRIRYDRLTQRWFIVIINTSTPNRILIAVSDAASAGVITGSTVWTFFFIPINTTPPTISATCLCDYPTLGVDVNALYIGGNNFCGGPPQTFNSTDGYVVRKSSIMGVGPIVVTVFRALGTGALAGPYTPQGVDNFDPAATEGYFIGVDTLTFGTLMLRRVGTPGGTPTISANIPITVSATSSPVSAPQMGSAALLDALDDRLFAAHIRNGRLWTAHNIAVNTAGVAASGAGVRDACRWYELQNIASPGTPSVVQSGTQFDNAAANPLHFWIPWIMVSGQGHAAMGFSRSGSATHADAFTNGRLTVNTLGTLQTPTALTASSTTYNQTGAPERWGDYSYTSVDPVDDQTMWTVQEFCSGNNAYAVRIAQLIAPPPPTPALATPSYATPGQASVNITITGLASEVTAGAGYFDTTPAGLWNPNRITATVSGGVTVNSISSVAPGSLVLNISTVGAPSDNTANTITITNPDGQSRNAAIFNVFAPAAVRVESFTASAASPSPGGGSGGSDVTIQWTTGFEVDNLGFNVYRVTKSGRQLITPKLIAGSALQSNATAQSSSGPRVYTYTDHPPRGSRGIRYVLEDIDLNGNATVHGPIRITRNGSGQNGSSAATKLVTLDELGGTTDSSEAAPFTPVEYTDEAPAFDKTADTAGPGGTAIKFKVKREGWYAITGRDLFAAGLDPAVNPANLQLWSDGRQIAMLVRGEADGRLDDTDTVEFYGGGLNLPSTDTRTFWLSTGAAAGLRIRQLSATAAPVVTPSFPFTVERKDRIVYFSALLNGDADNFLGSVVSATPVDQSITVQHLDTSPAKLCTLDIALRGITTGSHAVNVSFNGIPVGQATFEARELGRLTVTVPTQLVREGANVVRLTAVGAGYDVSAVDSIRLTYFHTAVADSDLLRATASGSSRGSGVTLSGFSNGTVRVVDVTTPAQPTEMLGTVAGGSSGYAATVLAQPGTRTLYAFTADQVRRPDAIVADRPSDLKSFDGADIVIVAPRDFAPALQPLVDRRRAQGFSVTVVDLEDVFDEFSYGERVPQALRAFAQWASTSWRVHARFLILAGDASFDPRDYFGRGVSDIVPTRLVDTRFMETASDDWFVDANGDGSPEIAIGRLPARTASDVATLVSKLVAYDSAGQGPSGALFVSDVGDTYDFHAANDRLRSILPAGTPVNEVRRDLLGDAAAHAAIVSGINAGPSMLTWNGHGSVDLWRGSVLTNADATALSNGSRLPLMSSMTCLNGYFIDPTLPSLSEAMLATPQGGVVGAWSGSGLSNPEEYVLLNEELYRQLFAGGQVTLGEAILRTKQTGLDVEARRTWIFLGDPSARLR